MVERLERIINVWDLIKEAGGTIEDCKHVKHKDNPGDVCTRTYQSGHKMCPGIEKCAYQTLLRGAQYIDEGR